MVNAPRVVLSALTRDDSSTLFRWINDRAEVLLGSAYHPVHELQHDEWFHGVQQQANLVIFGIRLADTQELIGSCQLRSIDWIHRTADLQIRIGDSRHRGHGYGTEAVRQLLHFAFHDLNLRRVSLQVFAANAVAVRVYEKAGFVREALLREAAYIDGRYVDVIVMGALRHDGDA